MLKVNKQVRNPQDRTYLFCNQIRRLLQLNSCLYIHCIPCNPLTTRKWPQIQPQRLLSQPNSTDKKKTSSYLHSVQHMGRRYYRSERTQHPQCMCGQEYLATFASFLYPPGHTRVIKKKPVPLPNHTSLNSPLKPKKMDLINLQCVPTGSLRQAPHSCHMQNMLPTPSYG